MDNSKITFHKGMGSWFALNLDNFIKAISKRVSFKKVN